MNVIVASACSLSSLIVFFFLIALNITFLSLIQVNFLERGNFFWILHFLEFSHFKNMKTLYFLWKWEVNEYFQLSEAFYHILLIYGVLVNRYIFHFAEKHLGHSWYLHLKDAKYALLFGKRWLTTLIRLKSNRNLLLRKNITCFAAYNSNEKIEGQDPSHCRVDKYCFWSNIELHRFYACLLH